jgi:hypothetical protein
LTVPCHATVPPRAVGGGQIRVGAETDSVKHLRHVLVVREEAVSGGSEMLRWREARVGDITVGNVLVFTGNEE